jgi:hypothetical protein
VGVRARRRQTVSFSLLLISARISDERFYELLNLAIDEYRTFSKSPTVSG